MMLESDSNLAVGKILKPTRSCDPLFGVIDQCKKLLGSGWNCSISHIYREAHYCADYLAGLVLSQNLNTELDNPPLGVTRFIQEDLVGVARPRAILV